VRLVLPLVACVLAAGCTTAVEGTPSAPTGVLLPPRPREVRLDGVDPCSLLTPEQRAELGLTSEPRASTSYVELFRGDVRTCTIRGRSPGSVLLGISVVTTVGIERWQEADVAAGTRPTSAAGFPALTASPQQLTDYCSVEVDVAEGQLLDVQFGAGGVRSPISQDELCRRAGQSAEAAMTTLLRH
jgi:hypothetical protein